MKNRVVLRHGLKIVIISGQYDRIRLENNVRIENSSEKGIQDQLAQLRKHL